MSLITPMLLANPPENIIPMTQQQARECADAIKGNLESLRFMLLDLQRRRGWEALGYSTWRECAQKEFGQSQGYVYKLLHAAEVEQNLAQFIRLDKTASIPVSQLEELHKLPADQQAAGLHRALEIASAEGRERTAIHVARAVREISGGDSTIADAPYSQDDEALRHFEAIATPETEPIEKPSSASSTTVTKATPKFLPFHCLLSQQQRERLFQAIVVAKNQRGLRTTAEALDAIAQGAVPKAIAQEILR